MVITILLLIILLLIIMIMIIIITTIPGKPAGGADLGLGIATAPVLFASEQFPRLNSLILRQFSQPGDVEEAFQLVLESEGLEQTKRLASRYSQEAVECLKGMREG